MFQALVNPPAVFPPSCFSSSHHYIRSMFLPYSFVPHQILQSDSQYHLVIYHQSNISPSAFGIFEISYLERLPAIISRIQKYQPISHLGYLSVHIRNQHLSIALHSHHPHLKIPFIAPLLYIQEYSLLSCVVALTLRGSPSSIHPSQALFIPKSSSTAVIHIPVSGMW